MTQSSDALVFVCPPNSPHTATSMTRDLRSDFKLDPGARIYAEKWDGEAASRVEAMFDRIFNSVEIKYNDLKADSRKCASAAPAPRHPQCRITISHHDAAAEGVDEAPTVPNQRITFDQRKPLCTSCT